jgi:hypothetical protein
VTISRFTDPAYDLMADVTMVFAGVGRTIEIEVGSHVWSLVFGRFPLVGVLRTHARRKPKTRPC